MKLRNCALICAALTALTLCSQAPAQAEHLDLTLTSPFLTLNIDADVAIPPGDALAVYATDYAPSTEEAWQRMFFGDVGSALENRAREYDADAELEYAHVMKLDGRFASYAAYGADLWVVYRDVGIMMDYANATPGAQAEGISTTPDQARAMALEWRDQLEAGLGWTGLELGVCYTMPPDGNMDKRRFDPNYVTNTTGYYIVELRRIVDGIPVAMDSMPDRTALELYGDGLRVYIDDAGIFLVEGSYRSFIEQSNSPIAVPLEEALRILEQNMDYAPCYPPDGNVEIREVGLCYRLERSKAEWEHDVDARVQARPAWRFAAQVNYNQTDVFVMFIDALTGEVLE